MERKLCLIGFMGSGKTTLGRALANALKRKFIDLDNFIEEKQNKSITDIFNDQGETSFRILETEALDFLLSQKEAAVIALGGGTPCSSQNWDLLSRHITIYLSCDVNILAARLEKEKFHRPLIKLRSGKSLIEYIENKMEHRKPFYEKATMIIDADNDQDSVLQKLQTKINSIFPEL